MAKPEQMSLDGVLDEDAPETPEVPETPEQPAGEAPPEPPEIQRNESLSKKHRAKEFAAQGRDPETGKFLPKEGDEKPETAAKPAAEEKPKEPEKPAPAAAPAQAPMSEREQAFLRAAQDERRKRQELEAKLAAQQKPAEAPKPFWEDPEGALKRIQEETASAVANARVQTAEMIARSRHTDFDEKLAAFAQIAQNAPGIAHACATAADPAEYAYNIGKNHLELQQLGGIEEMKKKVREDTEREVRGRIEVELKAKAEALAAEKAKIPGSLSSVPSAGLNRPVHSGPLSLDEILEK